MNVRVCVKARGSFGELAKVFAKGSENLLAEGFAGFARASESLLAKAVAEACES